ncbi:ras GTPase-activating-like protein Iqg1p [[Candida] railenensis]|uniref:Ras GTPase-activating-like protein Iqg1p n=1 Tax=[Candida] railenensis TaxID=45579 RepID=A0A9P0QW59_9ASCO|nr:ras GTPase-activating-like protein Iqg1p [[Candida] railenensis]
MKNNVALRYLESLDSVDSSPRYPLQPTSKYNSSPIKSRKSNGGDLDELESELNANISPLKGRGEGANTLSPIRFDSPSATISSFKRKNVDSSPSSGSADSNIDNGKPMWMRNLGSKTTTNANRLSPLKKEIGKPSDSNSIVQSPSASSTGYEYLCRIQALKNWLEIILQEEITQSPAELINYIRNGIHLAKLSNLILPNTRKVFTQDSKLQFKHTENINRFFQLLDYMNVPDLFRFELTDLYDAKNVPKVWFCIHALSYTIGKSDSTLPSVENLVGRCDFSEEDVKLAQRSLVGSGLPNFADVDNEGSSSYLDVVMSPVRPLPESPKRYQSPKYESPKFESPPRFQIERETVKEPEPQATPEPEQAISELDNPFIESRYVPEPIQQGPVSDSHANIIKLQALARGCNFRYSMFVDRIMLRSFDEELTHFVSIIRGNLSRSKTVHEHRTELLFFKKEIIHLQSSARKTLLKRKLVNLELYGKPLLELQSVIRAGSIRSKIRSQLFDLQEQKQSSIIPFQSILRTSLIHPRTMKLMEVNNDPFMLGKFVEFQTCCRSFIFKRFQITNSIKNSKTINTMIRFQSVIRQKFIKNQLKETRLKLYKSLTTVHELQSIGRGAIARTKLCNSVLITLIDEDYTFNELFAKVRGNRVRNEVYQKKQVIHHLSSPVFIPIQSIFRGILVRFSKEVQMEDLYQDIDSFIQLQSIIRGASSRNRIRTTYEYYHRNIDAVIKAQAIIKSKYAQAAYKGLLNMKSPPLSVIKKFAYLLTDNDIDYQEEMTLTELKDQIIDLAKNNEEIEQQIENLDIKLSLLDRNKISVDEFVKHKNKYKVSSRIGGIDEASVNDKTLEKSSRERLELYQKLFYLIQTNPQYLVRCSSAASEALGGNDTVANLVSCLYPLKDSSIDHHSREEYFLVKLTLAHMQADMNKSKAISDITKQPKTHWIEYFLKLNNYTFQRQNLKQIMGKITTDILDDDYIDFESNPSEIYRKFAEKRDGRLKEVPPPQVTIKDPEVSAKFVENLMSLREFTTESLDIISRAIHRIPLHVKIVCRQVYDLSKLNFPEKSEQQHLAVAGVVFAKHYLGIILSHPENFGLLHQGTGFSATTILRSRENLKHLNRCILQAFSLKPFNDNFLKPLNEHLTTCFDSTATTIRQIIDVGELDNAYDMNQYDDVVSHDRPQLTVKVHDMIKIAKLIKDNIGVAGPEQDDPLHILLDKIENLTESSTKDLIALAELGHVTLSLNPTTQEDSIQDSKSKILFSQAKRSLLYIIRIQDGPGLLELLISGISPKHEDAFKQIVSSEKSANSMADQSKRPYYKTSLGDLTQISYRDLKRMALEIILKLESEGKLTRKNSYQDLLNEIAIDIKTKHQQRLSRKQQMEIAFESQRKLSHKSSFLRKQLQDYNRHVEHILEQLQSKPKDKKKFLSILPVFSKQYFYQRELRKTNRLPKFGSYKYSSKKLLDQGIIKDYHSGKSLSSSSKLDFMFSCNEVGKFTIEAASGSVSIPGAVNMVTLDQLLNLQYEGMATLDLFDGMVSFDAQALMAFIFRKFYHADT